MSLRARLQSGKILVAPGAYDALSARLLEQAGFEAVYRGGYAASAAAFALPDLGITTLTDMVDHLRRMTNAIGVPVIADADTGYGEVPQVVHTVHELEAAGAAADGAGAAAGAAGAAAKGTRGPLVKGPPLCPHTTLLGVPPLVRTRKRPRQEPMRSLAQPFSSPSSHVKAYGRALLSTRRASQLSSQLPIGRATFLPVISTPQPARRPWI